MNTAQVEMFVKLIQEQMDKIDEVHREAIQKSMCKDAERQAIVFLRQNDCTISPVTPPVLVSALEKW